MSVCSNTSAIAKRINLLRLVLIGGIVLIHIPYGMSSTPYSDHFSAFNWFRLLFSDVIFRAGVPCLSAISGYLLFRNGVMPPYWTLVAKKLSTLALPMIFWNALLYVAVYLLQGYGVAVGYFPDLRQASSRETIDLLLAVSAEPINLPLYFLRDLFVCMMLAPAVGKAIQVAPVPTLIVLLAVSLSSMSLPLLLRADILFAFALGSALAVHKIRLTALDDYKMPIVVVFVALACALAFVLVSPGTSGEPGVQFLKKCLSLIGMIGFWVLSSWMAATPIGETAARSSRFSFWIFCSHYPFMVVLWMVWNKYLAEYNYAWFYCVAAFATVPILMILHSSMEPRLGSFIKLINGGR